MEVHFFPVLPLHPKWHLFVESSQAFPACPSDRSNIRMKECVWITGGMILTGENRSTGI